MSVKKNIEAPGRIGAHAAATAAHRHKNKLWVIGPQGGEWHSPENATDLVNLNGWKMGVFKTTVSADAEPVDPPEIGPGVEKIPDAPLTPLFKPDPELAELDALRAAAAELGVIVDNRWGKKTLAQEIQAAKDHAA